MRISDWSSDVSSSDLGAGSAPAAQLHYRDDNGQHVTLTMRAGGQAGQTSFTFARDGADSRFVWQDAHMAYSLVGTIAQEKLLEIAEAVSLSLHEERSEERRVGKECVSTSRYRCSPHH